MATLLKRSDDAWMYGDAWWWRPGAEVAEGPVAWWLCDTVAPLHRVPPWFQRIDGRPSRRAWRRNIENLFWRGQARLGATLRRDSRSVPAEDPRAGRCCKHCRSPDRNDR